MLIDDNRAVKTTNFTKPVYIGDPVNICKIFSDKEVDELCVLNIGKNRRTEGPNFELIRKIASETFVPLTYGGGVSTLSHFEDLFKIGVEKVVINTAFWHDLPLVQKAIETFGSQSVVLSLDFELKNMGLFKPKSLFFKAPRAKKSKLIPLTDTQLSKVIQETGFGEVILTDISRESHYTGLNLDLLKNFAYLSCPLIINGGLTDYDEIKTILNEPDVVAVAGGSLFTFSKKHRAVLLSYPSFETLIRPYYE